MHTVMMVLKIKVSGHFYQMLGNELTILKIGK